MCRRIIHSSRSASWIKVSRAWDDVSSATVINCFRHAGFVSHLHITSNSLENPEIIGSDDVRNLFDYFRREFPSVINDASSEDYINVDQMALTE
mgnify:CR=1 FL=1